MVEPVAVNYVVVGSNPTRGAILPFGVKVSTSDFGSLSGGSNPSREATYDKNKSSVQ